jgi:REP element-mobilizing transposase RayT
MLIQPYTLDELEFAWCYRIYLRWRTHRLHPQPCLSQLTLTTLNAIAAKFHIHVLESTAGETDVLLLLSLTPHESVSACASKLKGQITKWLRERLRLARPANLLSRGYFATTTGKSTSEAVEQYLSGQGEHHGYANRARPPLFLRRFEWAAAAEERVQAKHNRSLLQHHIVLATWRRKGVFGQPAGEAVAQRWRAVLTESQAALLKVSFVPDHVHLALRVHPAVSPAELIVRLMNESQELMWNRFDDSVIRAGAERLWQPTAYLGSYGDLASPQISQYIRDWEDEIRAD